MYMILARTGVRELIFGGSYTVLSCFTQINIILARSEGISKKTK